MRSRSELDELLASLEEDERQSDSPGAAVRVPSPIDSPVASPREDFCGQGDWFKFPLLDRRPSLALQDEVLTQVGKVLADDDEEQSDYALARQPPDSPRRSHDWDDAASPTRRTYRQISAERRLQRDMQRYHDSLMPIHRLGHMMYYWLFKKKDALRPPPPAYPRAHLGSSPASAGSFPVALPHRQQSTVPFPPNRPRSSSAPHVPSDPASTGSQASMPIPSCQDCMYAHTHTHTHPHTHTHTHTDTHTHTNTHTHTHTPLAVLTRTRGAKEVRSRVGLRWRS